MKRKQNGNKKATTTATTTKKTKVDGRKEGVSVQTDIRTFFFRPAPALENRPDGYETGDSDFEESSLARVQQSASSSVSKEKEKNPREMKPPEKSDFHVDNIDTDIDESQKNNTRNFYNNPRIPIAEYQDRHQITPSLTISGHAKPSPLTLLLSNDLVAAPQAKMDGEVPESYGGVILTSLGKKNYKKLLNPLTGKISEPPPKNCQECDVAMDWKIAGALQKRKAGNYTYQGHCAGECQKIGVNHDPVTGNPHALERDKVFKKQKAKLTAQFGANSPEVNEYVAQSHPTTGNLVNNDARRTNPEAFLKRLSYNLAENDNWLPAHNVHWFNTPQKYKPTPRACYSFVLKRLTACIDKVAFNPSVPTHLDELSDEAVAIMLRKVLDSNFIGEQSTMALVLLSHSGLGMLSLDREDSELAVNAPGQRMNVDCIAYQRLKNKYNTERLNAMIQVYRRIDFAEAAGALNGLITGIYFKPKKVVPQSVKDAILAVANTKWKNQHMDKRRAYILNKNLKFGVSKLKDIRKWELRDVKELLERLGYISPITGHVIDPDDFVFDRITDDSDYIINRVLVMSIQLNDAKSAGMSTNEFSTRTDLELMKTRRGWEGVDDRIVVVRLLHEFTTCLVTANGGFVDEE
ncbi:hypothetical protein BJ741DRAFT_644611 [Chytriomyces cf. hyalinus JEL632]|nr:hypothetical protein BJ741DRAFT_644611 [Chytriomyces cf. hyalinus JEL632]